MPGTSRDGSPPAGPRRRCPPGRSSRRRRGTAPCRGAGGAPPGCSVAAAGHSWRVSLGSGGRWTGGDQVGAQPRPRVVDGLVQSVAVGPQPLREHVDRDLVDEECQRDPALVRVRAVSIAERTAQARSTPSAYPAGLGPRDGTSASSSSENLSVLPREPSYLRGALEDRELVGPGREPAPPLERVQLREHRHHRLVRRLVGDLVDTRATRSAEGRTHPPEPGGGRPAAAACAGAPSRGPGGDPRW